jgi:hypothetical protein
VASSDSGGVKIVLEAKKRQAKRLKPEEKDCIVTIRDSGGVSML